MDLDMAEVEYALHREHSEYEGIPHVEDPELRQQRSRGRNGRGAVGEQVAVAAAAAAAASVEATPSTFGRTGLDRSA